MPFLALSRQMAPRTPRGAPFLALSRQMTSSDSSATASSDAITAGGTEQARPHRDPRQAATHWWSTP
jgi:hypothetical protein